jgi:uncharacterized protein (TIGR03118 family)
VRASLEGGTVPSGYVQTALVSDIPGFAPNTDRNLVNPWGFSETSAGQFRVAGNGSGRAILLDAQGEKSGADVIIPPPAGSPPGATSTPNGVVANPTSGFVITFKGRSAPATLLFSTEDGTIAGWNPALSQTHAVIAADQSGNGAVYKLLALGTNTQGTFIFATNFHNGTIDIFDSSFHLVHFGPNAFVDPTTGPDAIPSDFAPFGVKNVNGTLFVTYAKQDAAKHDDVAGVGNGFIDEFDTSGTFIRRFVTPGLLNSPIGAAIAPANFGQFSNDVLIGNFGDSHVNAFDPTTGAFLGQLTDTNGNPLVLNGGFKETDTKGLWGIGFGNGADGAGTNSLFFATGINEENDGLFGKVDVAPARSGSLLGNLASAPEQTISTVPPNGDLNPYGVAFVPQGFQGNGVLRPGDLLVSNFNNSTNTQGTGTTIVRITPDGQQSVFFPGAPGLGLTTALGVLRSGFVIVGNVPTDANGVAQQGSLLILDANGKLVATLSDSALLDGPWDLALNDQGGRAQVFVANVLSGTVSRIDLVIPRGGTPMVESITQIASGYAHRTDPTALVVGPTGLAYDPRTDTLYVASTADNAIYAIRDASETEHNHGTGRVVFSDPTFLHGPLGLVLAPNGDLIIANGDAVNTDPNHLNELVEITPTGKFVAQFQLDSGSGGAAFGIAVTSDNGVVRFATVDDNTNMVDLWTFQRSRP